MVDNMNYLFSQKDQELATQHAELLNIVKEIDDLLAKGDINLAELSTTMQKRA